MTRTWTIWIGIASLAAGIGCGGSGNQEQTESAIRKQVDEIQKTAEKMKGGNAEQLAQGFEAMAKGLGAMAGAATNASGTPVDPVGFRDLQTVFPELPGWEKSKPTGQRMTTPVNFSEAGIRYQKGDARIELKVVDSARHQLLVAPYAMFLTAGYEKETETGYEKSVKVGEYPGWEKWSDQNKDGELNAIVNQRFIVQVEARNVENAAVLRSTMEAIDLARLAAMK